MGIHRRGFLRQTFATGTLVGAGDLTFLSGLRPVSAEEAQVDTRAVQLRPEIEPLVRLLEETPRDRLLEQIAARIRQGLSYREILAALLLAGVRNVQPRPSVGFKFHAVLVVNSAHLASLASPDSDRWLPIFWALDYFKSSQQRDVQEGNWTMLPVDETAVPAADKARVALAAALESWDVAAADTAVAGLVRHGGANELFELFARYGSRDYRSIGHKAIFVANSWRTLQCIGWQHAEPVLRSLAYALLNHTGEPNPADHDLPADRPWRENLQRTRQLRADWLVGQASSQATLELLGTIHRGTPAEASEHVVQLLNDGIAVDSLYDAIFAAAGELLMRQRGIVSLHAVTTTNAMHYAFRHVADPQTRQLILLQNAAFLPLFRQSMVQRGQVEDLRLEQLEAAPDATDPATAIQRIFDTITRDRTQAAQQVLAYLKAQHSANDLMQAARRLIFLKGNDSHDYKFSSAVLEDFYRISPTWRNRYLAASVFQLRGRQEPDNALTARTRAALAGGSV